MNDERSKQDTAENQGAETPQCGPDCKCGATGLNTKGKAIICLIIAIVAALFVMRGFARNADSAAAQGNGEFATTVPAAPAMTQTVTTTTTNMTKPIAWGQPLTGLASINEVAADTDAVFVYLPEKEKKPQEAIKRTIEQAAAKTASNGMTVSYFTLDTSSQDYAQTTAQSSAPCVLAMVKGGGVGTVSGEITVKKLLEAVVAASRPSSCGPSGCGPSTPSCD